MLTLIQFVDEPKVVVSVDLFFGNGEDLGKVVHVLRMLVGPEVKVESVFNKEEHPGFVRCYSARLTRYLSIVEVVGNSINQFVFEVFIFPDECFLAESVVLVLADRLFFEDARLTPNNLFAT